MRHQFLILLWLTTTSCGFREEAPERLQLTEKWSQSLPSSIPVIGALIVTPDSVIAWSGGSDIQFLRRGGGTQVLTVSDSAEIVDIARDDLTGQLLAVDARGNRLLVLDSSASVVRTMPLIIPLGSRIIECGLLGNETILGIQDSVGSLYTVVAASDSGNRLLWGVRSTANFTDPGYRLSVIRDTILIAQTRFPFDLIEVTADGRSNSVRSSGIAIGTDSMQSLPLWRALRVVPLDFGALQSHAALSSDQRRLIRYSQSWIREAVSVVEVPFAVVTSQPRTNTLVGARIAGALEIVVYRWEWRSGREN